MDNRLRYIEYRPFTMLHTDFLDCEHLNSNEKMLLIILLRYGRYGKDEPLGAFPGYAGLAKKAGLTEKIVRLTLHSLEEKKLITRQARYLENSKARAANFYVIRDTPEVWASLDTEVVPQKYEENSELSEAIRKVKSAGYMVVEPIQKKASSSDAPTLGENDENSKEDISFVDIQGTRPFKAIYNDFLDCEGLRSKEKLLMVLLMRYGAASETGAAFPSVNTLARKTGMSERTVQYTLKKLIDKKMLVRQARYTQGKGQTSNIYTVDASFAVKGFDNHKELQKSLTQEQLLEMINVLRTYGYTVEAGEEEKSCGKKMDKKKASSSDAPTPEKDEPLSKEDINFVDFSISNDTLLEEKSQAKKQNFHHLERNFSTSKVDKVVTLTNSQNEKNDQVKYTVEQLRERLNYWKIQSLTSDPHWYGSRESSIELLDAIVDTIYDTVNSKAIDTKIGGQSYSTKIVTDRLLKLTAEDVAYVMMKYKQYPRKVYSSKPWLLTGLYNAKIERAADNVNQATLVENMQNAYLDGDD